MGGGGGLEGKGRGRRGTTRGPHLSCQTPARAVRLVWATATTATAMTAPEAARTSSDSAHQSADHSLSWPWW